MGAKKTGKDEDDEDDPIAKSLKEREKAGGVTQVVSGDKTVKKPVGIKPPTTNAKPVKEEKKQSKEDKKEEKKDDKKEEKKEKLKDDKDTKGKSSSDLSKF